MRILYFTRDYSPHDYRFLSSLAKTEHSIFSLRLERRSYQQEDRLLPAEVQAIRWEGGQSPVSFSEYPKLSQALEKVITEVKPDLIHAGSIQTSAFVTALAGFQPLVSMSWGTDLLKDADRSPFWRWITRFTLRRTRVLVGDCQAVKEKAVSFGFDPNRVVLFPWGVDLGDYSVEPDTTLREKLGWQDAFVLLSMRSWEPVYGVDIVLKAFFQAAQRYPQLRLLLLGNGSQSATLMQLIKESGMEDRIYLGGQVSHADLPHYYQAADLYVSASHSDGSSVSLMEALACGRPVAVSDIPGNLEWITEGSQGWLFADGDIHSLARCIEQAALHPEVLSSMHQASRRLAEQRANWAVNFQQLFKAYAMAMQEAQ